MKLETRTLEGRFVRLEPLEARHYDALRRACDADPEVWALYPFPMNGKDFGVWAAGVAKRVARGDAVAFAVVKDGAVAGTTSYSTVDLLNKRVEIGNTYYHPDARGGVVNPESKLLLLDHAFASGAQCVQFRVDAINARSRAAVAKLGAKQDGILRRDRITWTGRARDTVVFSILDEEWPETQKRLMARLEAFA